MALSNVTQLKEVLDAIYQDAQSPDRYSGDEKNGLTLYYNKMESRATIFKYTENGLESVIAIFDPKVVAYTDQELVEFYNCKQINDGSIRSTGLDISGRGLGTYIGLKTMIRNCLAFLGVGTDEDFDSKNPVIYNDMVNIVHKYTDELDDNVEGYWGKYSDNDVVSYRPYIPVLIILDLAIYLNSFNFFEQQIKLYNISLNIGAFYKSGTPIENLVCKFSDFYQTLDKEKFFDNFKKFLYKTFNNAYSDRINQALNTFKTIYGNSIDFNKIVFIRMSSPDSQTVPGGYNLSREQSYVIVEAYTIPKECFLYGTYSGGRYYWLTNGYSFNVINNVSNFTRTKYYVELNWSGGELTVTNSETDLEVQKNTVVNFSSAFINIDCNIYYKTYNSMLSYRYSSVNHYGYNLSYFGVLSNNTFYDRDQLHFADRRSLAVIDYYLYQILVDNNINITSDDLAFYARYNSDIFLFIFNNINEMKSNMLETFCNLGSSNTIITDHIKDGSTDNYYDYAVQFFTMRSSLSATLYDNSSNCTIDFDRSTQMKIYKLTYANDNTYNFELYNSGNSDSFNIKSYFDTTQYPSLTYFWTNLGELTELNEVEFDGMYLLEGATYPRSINTISQFKSLYNNAIYRGINNPYFTDGELNDHLINWEYVNCSVSKTPPDNQADAQDFDLDDLSDDEVADIIKDIDKASGDDDSPEDDVPPTDNKIGDDIGETPPPDDVRDIPSALSGNIVKMYHFDMDTISKFSDLWNGTDFWTNVYTHKLASANDAIIAFTYGICFDETQALTIQGDFVVNNYPMPDPDNPTQTMQVDRVWTSYEEHSFGEIDIPGEYSYENYLDITNTTMQLYLPFVGLLDLNIADFFGGKMRIDYMVDHCTGCVYYTIYSIRNGKKKVISVTQGVCECQIPLKSENMSRLIQSMLPG